MSVLRLFAFRFARKVSEFSVKSMICEVLGSVLSKSKSNPIQSRIQSSEGLCLVVLPSFRRLKLDISEVLDYRSFRFLFYLE
jgi:hypothetical protein